MCTARMSATIGENKGGYRDDFNKKKEEEILIISTNINSLQYEKWKAENNIIRDFLKHHNPDIVGFQEVNINWDKVPARHNWKARTIG